MKIIYYKQGELNKWKTVWSLLKWHAANLLDRIVRHATYLSKTMFTMRFKSVQ